MYFVQVVVFVFFQSSGLYFASSEAETPPPSMPAPPPPMRGAGRVEGRRIPLLERLLRTQAVWYLPNIGRAGAVHLLQNKIPGVSKNILTLI